MTNRIGQQLGNYRLTRLLGQGGFADVYLGEHIHLSTRAALKVLQMRLVGSNLEEFRNEARTIATLIHPHIVRILDFGEEEGTPFLVMDYAPNGSLRHRYPKGTRLPLEQVVFYLKQIASALHYAHTHKLIHRDVKPENMLLSQEDNVLISDFGLVLVAQSTGSQITRAAAGTLPYMAPEQLQGKPRPASDQYALGIVAYEWLCGERPFQGSAVELMGQHALTPPPSLCAKVPDLPQAVEAVVLKALAKDPQERFANVEEFASAFETAYEANRAKPEQSLATLSLAEQTSIRPVGHPTPPSGISLDEQTQQLGRLNTPVLPLQESWSTAPSSASSVHTPSELGEVQSVPPDTPVSRSDALSTGAMTFKRSSAHNLVSRSTMDTPSFTPSFQASSSSIQITSPPQPTGAAGPPLAGQTATPIPKKIRQTRRTGKRLWLIAAFLCVVLLGGGLVSLNFIRPGDPVSLFRPSSPSSSHHSATPGGGKAGGASATVTITPSSQDLKQTSTITAVTGRPDATQQQVQARILTDTSSPQSLTVNTTGAGTVPATQASGKLTFSGSTYYGSCTIPAGTIYASHSGVNVATDADVTITSANSPQMVSAHAVQAGASGNIPANSITIVDLCYRVSVTNDQAFTGGQDAQSYSAVAQSDLDGATGSLVSSLTPSTQSAVEAQVSANERSVGSPQCDHQENANHQVGEQATSVTVTVTVTCTLESYDYNAALALAAQWLNDQAAQNPGTSYALVGHVSTILAQVSVIDANNGTLAIKIDCEGIWVYSFTPEQQQALKTYMAGKSKTAMLSWLLNQRGVGQASIQISAGDQNTLPSDSHEININVQAVQGQ